MYIRLLDLDSCPTCALRSPFQTTTMIMIVVVVFAEIRNHCYALALALNLSVFARIKFIVLIFFSNLCSQIAFSSRPWPLSTPVSPPLELPLKPSP